MRDLMEPRGQIYRWWQASRVASQIGENRLCYFLSQLRQPDLAQGGGMNQVNMAAHYFGKRVLGALERVPGKEFIITIAHFYIYIGA
jgi:hypothetical protein